MSLLRYKADRRTVAYLAVTVGLSIYQWNQDHWNPLLYAWALFMGVTVAVISHNHNHLGMWKSRYANLVTNWVLAMYYGTPTVAWVPTHNQAHHKLNFQEGDSSRGPKGFKGNHLLSVLVYPTLTGMAQMPEIKAYIAQLKRTNRKAYLMAISEFVVFFGMMALLLLLDWKKALIYFVIPQQFSLFMIQVFNYVQHVETGTGTRWNHSRNFVSPLLNALLFNNGYHTVHHWKPGIHWSQTPAVHAEHAHKIHPSLNEKSWWWFMIRTYLLRPFLGAPTLPDYGPVVTPGSPMREERSDDAGFDGTAPAAG
ncbi:MAG TPA: fatty acid desaturase [Myxococcaceae bacterium]|nr:fatty acid desaturase [Myxococcaceae bacterium]